MAKIPTAIIVAILMVLFISVNGEKKPRHKRYTVEVVTNANVLGWLCQNNPWGLYMSWCSTTTASPQTSTAAQGASTTSPGSSSTGASSSASSSSTGGSTSPPSVLQSAHWCQFSNGTYLSLGQTYLAMPCLLCQCAQSQNIVCNTLQCMPSTCIDGSTPTVKPGNCCPTCSYETQATPCTQNGVTFPYGTIITTVANSSQCWCQSGTIECRRTIVATVYTTWEYFGTGTTTYVIIIVVCIILMLGTLLCCGCTLLYYYYYQSQQQSIQQAYEQYYNNAGWQPMGEEGQFGDTSAKESEAAGEQGQFEQQYPTGQSPDFIPPPYAVYNGPYGTEKDQKHV